MGRVCRISITILLVAIASLVSHKLFSQGKSKITGTVIDSALQTPVDLATVSIFKVGVSRPFNGVIADKKGNFQLTNLPAGDYRVTVDFVGYVSKSIEPVSVQQGAATLSLGNIILVHSQQQLQGITVTARAPVVQNKIDKLVYNAADDLTAQGGVALDVLKKVPMVSVDIDGNVELQGNGNVRFLIDGKPSTIFGASLVDALQSIPASQIKSIEVITSPGAKYDAAGTGGIINIVLKDNKVRGINGSVNLSAGTRLENGSVNLNARTGKIGLGLFFNGNEQINVITKNTSNRLSYNNTRDTIAGLFQQGSNPFTRGSYQSGLNFNWTIRPKEELTATIGYHHFGNHGSGTTLQDQQMILASSGALLSDVMSTRTADSRGRFNSTDWSLGYKKFYKKEGQELDILYTSSIAHNTMTASQVSDYVSPGQASSGLRSNNPGNDHQSEFSVDYTAPVAKGFTIETGAKLGLENLNNNVVTDTLLGSGAYINNHGQSYGFNYKRSIFAAYISTSFTVFKGFLEGKLGMRYERTNTTADFAGVSIPGYNTFAPSFMAQHKLDETQSVKFAYTNRIERPDYGDLNPFYNISDPHNVSTGNPLLRPELGHGFELGYNKTFKKGGNIYVAAFYRHNTDDIQGFSTYYPVLDVDGTNYTDVTLTQRYNIGWQTNTGVSIFGSIPITAKLNLRSNIQMSERINSTPGLATVSGFAYRINLNASYQFPHDLTAELFGNYNSSQKNIQGTRPVFFFYNMAVRKQFYHKKGSIGLTTTNPFGEYVKQRSTSFGPNFNQENIRLVPLRSFGITISYKFGKLEFKKNREDEGGPQAPPEN